MFELLGGMLLKLVRDAHVFRAFQYLRIDDIGNYRLILAREILIKQRGESFARKRLSNFVTVWFGHHLILLNAAELNVSEVSYVPRRQASGRLTFGSTVALRSHKCSRARVLDHAQAKAALSGKLLNAVSEKTMFQAKERRRILRVIHVGN